MAHITADNKQLLTRIRRIKGQAEAMEKALSANVDCAAILQQIASIRGAVNGLMAEVLESHIREHLGPGAPADKHRQDMDDVITVLRSYLK